MKFLDKIRDWIEDHQRKNQIIEDKLDEKVSPEVRYYISKQTEARKLSKSFVLYSAIMFLGFIVGVLVIGFIGLASGLEGIHGEEAIWDYSGIGWPIKYFPLIWAGIFGGLLILDITFTFQNLRRLKKRIIGGDE